MSQRAHTTLGGDAHAREHIGVRDVAAQGALRAHGDGPRREDRVAQFAEGGSVGEVDIVGAGQGVKRRVAGEPQAHGYPG